ncbi:glucosamine kinase [Mycolicibacterium sp. A43C]
MISDTDDPLAAPLDLLPLGDRHALAIISSDGELSAVPVVRDGGVRRASPGDGAAEALLELIVGTAGRTSAGRFEVVSWANGRVPNGERAVGVDQTNESVIVGDTAVVKWSTHLEPGPHPAAGRLTHLIASGFTAMPTPWAVLTWVPDDDQETLVATVTGYLPGAVDGWTWAVDLFLDAARTGDHAAVLRTCASLGEVIADMHCALSATVTIATDTDARRWRDNAFTTFDAARRLADPQLADLLTRHVDAIATTLQELAGLTGVPILDAHGDLHVGQILSSSDTLLINDFDGNPVLPPAERALPAPAAVDLAGIIQSLTHVGIVAARRGEFTPEQLRPVELTGRTALYDAYLSRLTDNGHVELHIDGALIALRLQQVLREIVYAGRHLPRWMYVPDAALPALLHEMSR